MIRDETMWARALAFIDWFVPEAATAERSDLSLARNFVFTHLFGPLLSQSISVFLYFTDPHHGFAFWTMIVCIWSFWALPFVLKYTRNLQLSALLSVEILAFASLFGAYYYGGVSSPFLPWLIVSLLLGFFYLSDKPALVIGMFVVNIGIFLAAYAMFGFAEQVPLDQLAGVGWISILSATIYMSWMAVYYANIMSMRSEVELETERHRLTSTRLRQAKEVAESADRSKSIFLAKMSHELRTPLNAVIGYSEILLEEDELDGKKSARRTDLTRINAAGKHLLSLVNDVLDLSKIESNHIEVRREVVGLTEFLSDIIGTMLPMATERQNKIVFKPAGTLGNITTDSTKLRQVVLNLLGNAIKFTASGTVTLSARRDSHAVTDWIEIQVRDTGIGIAAEDLGKLFQDFQQARPDTSSRYGGTGLGLAISQKFCALMGGSIKATSELGRGSCFTVRIPAAPIESTESESDDAPAGAESRLALVH